MAISKTLFNFQTIFALLVSVQYLIQKYLPSVSYLTKLLNFPGCCLIRESAPVLDAALLVKMPRACSLVEAHLGMIKMMDFSYSISLWLFCIALMLKFLMFLYPLI